MKPGLGNGQRLLGRSAFTRLFHRHDPNHISYQEQEKEKFAPWCSVRLGCWYRSIGPYGDQQYDPRHPMMGDNDRKMGPKGIDIVLEPNRVDSDPMASRGRREAERG